METGNVPDRSNNISVSIGLQNVMGRFGTEQKATRYNGNIVYGSSSSYVGLKELFFNLFDVDTNDDCYGSFEV